MFKLRPFQESALKALEEGEHGTAHVLCVAPTGSGKSLIYEKAASFRGRRTILVTPLVALARQQFERLKAVGIPVTLGAGGESQGPPQGETGAWIISPEILNFASRHSSLRSWKPNLLVVDECHCLWEWGDRFRPAFNQIPKLIHDYSISKSLWLTATLPYEARFMLKQTLPEPVIEIGSFDLPVSLSLRVQQVPWRERVEKTMNWIRKTTQPGMIFVPTREATQRVARLVASTGKHVMTYHGGMSREERKNTEVLVAQGIPDVIVATSAFGMGMNYLHLSYVILWQAPMSLLSLVQTMGRVGRNPTQVGHALVFWDYEDFQLLEWTIQDSSKRQQEMSDLLKFLSSKECRRHFLRHYFEPYSSEAYSSASSGIAFPRGEEGCGSCDVCSAFQEK